MKVFPHLELRFRTISFSIKLKLVFDEKQTHKGFPILLKTFSRKWKSDFALDENPRDQKSPFLFLMVLIDGEFKLSKLLSF